MPPQKAYIALIPPKSTGGSELGRVDFQYNPKEFSYKKSAQWDRKPARGAKKSAPPEFKGADPVALTVEVFLDGYEDGQDVSASIETLKSCCVPLDTTIHSKKPSPPWVIFGWGSQVHITAFVRSVDVKCTMFSPEGIPLRAVCTVTMEEISEDPPGQNPTSGSRNSKRSRTLTAGETLHSIAYREYGNPTYWRRIAEANGIDDPFRVAIGRRLLVPELENSPAGGH
jgi:nucleoid-associated protein YgaU